MRRIVVVILTSCLFAMLGAVTGPAEAADYYGGHPYRHASHGGDWRARPVIGYESRVRYLRLVEQLPYCAYCDRSPVLYQADPYWSPVYAAAGVCLPQRVRIVDRRGGWVWGVRPVCY